MIRPISIRLAIALVAFCLPLIPNSASAQEEKGKLEVTTPQQKPLVAYRIEFNVREMENGKRLNSRNYMLVATDDNWSKIRVGNRVPYQASDNSYQFTDVRMNIDCRPHERNDSVALSMVVEFSSFAPPAEAAPKAPPVFRTERTDVDPVVTPGKPTLVASMDDVVSNRRYEIEVTATKVK